MKKTVSAWFSLGVVLAGCTTSEPPSRPIGSDIPIAFESPAAAETPAQTALSPAGSPADQFALPVGSPATQVHPTSAMQSIVAATALHFDPPVGWKEDFQSTRTPTLSYENPAGSVLLFVQFSTEHELGTAVRKFGGDSSGWKRGTLNGMPSETYELKVTTGGETWHLGDPLVGYTKEILIQGPAQCLVVGVISGSAVSDADLALQTLCASVKK